MQPSERKRKGWVLVSGGIKVAYLMQQLAGALAQLAS
jgi:hypothetical protein